MTETIGQQIKKMQSERLEDLIMHFGNKYRMAKALGDSPQSVNGWCSRGRISAKAAIKAEKITGGKFKKEELRPDVVDWE